MTLLKENEKGAAAYYCLDAANQFLLQVLPSTPKEDVLSMFQPLYADNPDLAFKLAMMFGNLRPGGGGRPNMGAFVACMEHVWAQNPAHLTANIENIMEDVSCKMALVLLKHLSNLDDPASPNNYWGNLDLILKKKEKKWARTDDTWSEQAKATKKQKRRDRFAAHLRVLEEFAASLNDPSITSAFQIVQRRANLPPRKTCTVDIKVPVPETEKIRVKYEEFLANRKDPEDKEEEEEEEEEYLTKKQKRDKMRRERYFCESIHCCSLSLH